MKAKSIASQPSLTVPQLKRQVGRIGALLEAIHSRLPRNLPDEVQINVAGAAKFMSMTNAVLAAASVQADTVVERQLKAALPAIRHATEAHGFHGFGGECFAAAIAMNRVLFDGKLSYCLALNEALHGAGRAIGHASLFTLSSSGDRLHIDADGRIKSDIDIESWGVLDHEDFDYLEIADELGVEWNERTASAVALFEATEAEVLKLTSEAEVDRLEEVLRQSTCEMDLEPAGTAP